MNRHQVQQAFPVDLARRLEALHRDSGDRVLLELVRDFAAMLDRVQVPGARPSGRRLSLDEAYEAEQVAKPRLSKPEVEQFRDKLSTRLMETFRVTVKCLGVIRTQHQIWNQVAFQEL